jgi:hypothetical protein
MLTYEQKKLLLDMLLDRPPTARSVVFEQHYHGDKLVYICRWHTDPGSLTPITEYLIADADGSPKWQTDRPTRKADTDGT